MKTTTIIAVTLMASALSFLNLHADEPSQKSQAPVISPPTTVAEARARAKLLYETLRGSLQVMHRDFFEDDGSSAIPSASLEDVFLGLSENYGIEVQWLIIDTDVMNIDHKPKNEFEKKAAKALSKGKTQFELVEPDKYRYVGSIQLGSQCLKCHLRGRTSTDDRAAGLLISMPLGKRVAKTDKPTPKAD